MNGGNLPPVVRTNARRDKAGVLLEVREEVEQLKFVLGLCQDVKAFASFKACEPMIAPVVTIAKQNEGWLRIPVGWDEVCAAAAVDVSARSVIGSAYGLARAERS